MAKFWILLIAFFVLVASLFYRNKPASELLSKKYLDRILAQDGQYDPTAKKAVWFNKEIPLPGPNLAEKIVRDPVKVLGQTTDEKWIEVNLTAQHLYAHEGNRIVFDFPVSTGLPWMPTVTGEFYIWAKVRAQRMTGGSVAAGTYYDLPNVPFVQYFYGGYSLHGTYWHNDFGKPRSHGCVNVSIPNSERLFWWTNPDLPQGIGANYHIQPSESTRVVVYGTTPSNIN